MYFFLLNTALGHWHWHGWGVGLSIPSRSRRLGLPLASPTSPLAMSPMAMGIAPPALGPRPGWRWSVAMAPASAAVLPHGPGIRARGRDGSRAPSWGCGGCAGARRGNVAAGTRCKHTLEHSLGACCRNPVREHDAGTWCGSERGVGMACRSMKWEHGGRNAVQECGAGMGFGSVPQERGVGERCGNLVEECGVGTRCRNTLQERSAGVRCGNVVREHGAGTWCKNVVRECGVGVRCRNVVWERSVGVRYKSVVWERGTGNAVRE